MSSPSASSPEKARFVEDLLSYMTLDEKIGQLRVLRLGSRHRTEAGDITAELLEMVRAGKIAAIEGVASRKEALALQNVAVRQSRFGIPLLFSNIPGKESANPWPQSLAMAASWDVSAVSKIAHAVASEAIDRGWNLVATPPVRLLDDYPQGPASSFGSNEHLAASVATAMIQGLQGTSPADPESVLGLLRYGPLNATGHDKDATTRALRTVLSSSHIAAIYEVLDDGDAAEADPGAPILESYSGIDLGAWRRLARMGNAQPHEFDHEGIADAIEDGHLSAGLIDDAVRRVLAAKSDLGLFRDPFAKFEKGGKSDEIISTQWSEACGQLARQSCVLLKNEDGILPLSIDTGNVLIVGADEKDTEFLHDALERCGIQHRSLTGLAIRGESIQDRCIPIPADGLAIGMACDAAMRAETVIFFVTDQDCHFDPSRPVMRLGAAIETLFNGLCSSGKHIVLIEATSLPVDLGEKSAQVQAQLLCWRDRAGLETTLPDILTGELSPAGRLPFALPAWEGSRELPVGYGLHYSEVHGSKLTLELAADCLMAETSFTNTGMHSVVETILLYVRNWTPLGDAEPELRGFQRLALEPGQTKSVRFEIGARELGRISPEGRFIVEPGAYEVLVGCEPSDLSARQIDLPESMIRAMAGAPRADSRRAVNG